MSQRFSDIEGEESPWFGKNMVPSNIAPTSQCEFFYDPSERGFYLEDSDNFSKCIQDYEIPQRLLEKIMENANKALKRNDIKAITSPETVFDSKTVVVLKSAAVLFFLFFMISVVTLYLERSELAFTIGFGIFVVGLLGFLLIIITNGDFRCNRKSKYQVSEEQANLIQRVLTDIIEEGNQSLEEYHVYLKFNHNSSKIRLLPLDSTI